MTTRPSSLPPGLPPEVPQLVDAAGLPIPLGREVGSGGEGRVLVAANRPGMAVKIYHRNPLLPPAIAKLDALISRRSDKITAFSAWPQEIVYDANSREPRGLVMPLIRDGRRLHELYGTTTRRRNFADAMWPHLILAARNTAAAFEALHTARIIIGDVNQGNLLVDNQMCVRFIDCDSFQIQAGEQIHHCTVGTPHFTPPELQMQKLSTLVRTENHDAFGLAVLIFHLLFVGRHPFAGRYHSSKDVPIESAISQHWFAFSPKMSQFVSPPPCSLLLEDLSPEVGRLFERAFLPIAAPETNRPTASEWVVHLDELLKRRRGCDLDPAHSYFRELQNCPWCRIEVHNGPSYFGSQNKAMKSLVELTDELTRTITQFANATFPEPDETALQIPHIAPEKLQGKWTRFRLIDAMAILWLIGIAGTVAGRAIGILPPLIGAGTLLLSGAYLLGSKTGLMHRTRVCELWAKIDGIGQLLQAKRTSIFREHAIRRTNYEQMQAELESEIEFYNATGDDLKRLVATYEQLGRKRQLYEYLSQFALRNYQHEIVGLTKEHVAMLRLYGVETAAESEIQLLYGVPNVSLSLAMALDTWRTDLIQKFVFKPELGTSTKDLDAKYSDALLHFKNVQSKKILRYIKQSKISVSTETELLVRGKLDFLGLLRRWELQAQNLIDLQQGRSPVEVWVNQNAWIVGSVTLAVLVFGAIILALS